MQLLEFDESKTAAVVSQESGDAKTSKKVE